MINFIWGLINLKTAQWRKCHCVNNNGSTADKFKLEVILSQLYFVSVTTKHRSVEIVTHAI